MATVNADVMTQVLAGTGVKIAPVLIGGKLRAFCETVQYDGQGPGSSDETIRVARLPAGARVIGFIFNATATAGGTATLALGITGSTGLFRAAATFTAANTPTWVNTAAGMFYEITAETDIIITVAAADLPTSADYLTVTTVYVIP